MAVYAILKAETKPRTRDDRIERHFSGAKAAWRETFENLHAAVDRFGGDVGISPTNSYLSFVRDGKKFAIVQIVSDHLDIGIKRKGSDPTGRFTAAGSWNAMVTHRVRIGAIEEVDAELIAWLRQAYKLA